MNTLTISILLLISLIITEISAQMLLKNGNINLYYLGLLMYTLVGILFAISLKYQKFGTFNLMWHLSMVLATLLVSFFIYKEKYSITEYIGIILGLMSLSILLTKHKH